MPVGVDDMVPDEDLVKVCPNPFRDHVMVEVDLQENKIVLIEVFDLNGRKVSEKYNGKLPGGKHQFIININNSEPSQGIYLIKVSLGNKVFCNKLMKKT